MLSQLTHPARVEAPEDETEPSASWCRFFWPFYTYLSNRTGSVIPYMVLHGSFTAAQDHLTLLAREAHGLTDAPGPVMEREGPDPAGTWRQLRNRSMS